MTDAVWPDGARGAVTDALRRDSVEGMGAPLEDRLLNSLEPFVQQRITKLEDAWMADFWNLSGQLDEYNRVLRDHNNTATPEVLRGLLDQFKACRAERDLLKQQLHEAETRNGITGGVYTELYALRAEVARLRQERDDANALGEARRLGEEGAREMLNEERAERSQAEQILADVNADWHRLRAELARLREDGERRQAEVLQLRALVAALPIGECQASAALQGWWDQMKAVMAGTNPVWLVEPRGCPTPGACSCPGVRLDAARSARGGEG